MIFYRKERRQVKIDISPLIDVVLSLVIFFILSTTFIQKYGLKLELPKSKKGEISQETTITVIVDREGKIYLDKAVVPEQELKTILEDKLKIAKEKKVIVKADYKLEYGKIVKIMDIIRDSGATGLSIATTKEKESSGASLE